ncbi:10820_t:CDS:2 [Paraglomus occultum]|uniref:10820_t:CDS:1 n=1 Tax=Paraglomus occultum TaxID=144539 RepID=A0A9N9BKY9_9GLOM|nr:10820_t:CDS:2 [Paraglomus occultum]
MSNGNTRIRIIEDEIRRDGVQPLKKNVGDREYRIELGLTNEEGDALCIRKSFTLKYVRNTTPTRIIVSRTLDYCFNQVLAGELRLLIGIRSYPLPALKKLSK